MIEGRFGDKGQVYFEIDLIGGDGFSFPVETMLDTGFTEFLAMKNKAGFPVVNPAYCNKRSIGSNSSSVKYFHHKADD
ncbi:hypothetical protein NIES2107_08290 [Nostoc carneum NIES-2107]|nr:hypothetical protein NIES2107_08290 [Nostoc carneum NIES-2107]